MEIPTESLSFTLVDDVYALGEEWDLLVKDNVFLKHPFLSIIQDSPLESIKQHYIKVYHGNTLKGVIVLQLKHFQLKESLRKEKKASNIFQKVAQWIKFQLSGFVDYRIMVVGNLLLTGNYGYHLDDSIPKAEDIPFQFNTQMLTEFYWKVK